MENNLSTIIKLKNAEGKRILEETILGYSKEIIQGLQDNPEIIHKLVDMLEVTEDELLAYLSGELTANITLYDQTLTLTKNLVKEESNKQKG